MRTATVTAFITIKIAVCFQFFSQITPRAQISISPIQTRKIIRPRYLAVRPPPPLPPRSLTRQICEAFDSN